MKCVPWKEFNPRAFPGPTVALVDFGTADKPAPLYCVAGTDYGYLHGTNGYVRTWQTYGAARKVCRAYIEARKQA